MAMRKCWAEGVKNRVHLYCRESHLLPLSASTTLAMAHWPCLLIGVLAPLCNVFRERDIVRREDSQEGPFSSLQEFREFKDSQRQAKQQQQQQQQQSQPAQSSSDTQRRASSSQASSSNSSNGSSPSRGAYTRSRSGRKEYDSL